MKWWLVPATAVAAVPVLVLFVLAVPVLLVVEALEAALHRSHWDNRPWCLRCVRRAVYGRGGPAGRWL